MNQKERREYLINELLKENPSVFTGEIPNDEISQKSLLRALMNVREAKPIDEDILKIQDEYLSAENERRGIVDVDELKPVKRNKNMFLWQGDITRLKADGIVNAANSALLGCFVPNHSCIDNVIHTYSGMQLRLECDRIMKEQGFSEPTGRAKITGAYNLPCKYVLHTVGPIISGTLKDFQIEELSSCYRSCLDLAMENNLKSIAFCCISTGVFHFPQDIAAKTAVEEVEEYLKNNDIKVIFNVFTYVDYNIYSVILN